MPAGSTRSRRSSRSSPASCSDAASSTHAMISLPACWASSSTTVKRQSRSSGSTTPRSQHESRSKNFCAAPLVGGFEQVVQPGGRFPAEDELAEGLAEYLAYQNEV